MVLNKIQKLIVDHKFLWLLLTNIIFFISAAYLLPIRYEQNDDVMMLLFASGKYSGTPESHLVFINYLYGLFLKLLYTRNDGLEWYSILFAIINILSITVISWNIVVKKGIRPFYKILFLFIFYLLEIRFLQLLQFTTIASLCALAAIILILSDKNYQRIAGVFLFILASMIRFEAALLILMIAGPLFINALIGNKKIAFEKPLQFIVGAFILAMVFKFIDYNSYQSDKEWKYFNDYNKVRGQINDNPNAAQLRKKLPTNILTADFDFLLGATQDGEKMNLHNLQLLQSRLKEISIKDKISHIPNSLRSFKFFLLGLIVACGGLIYANPLKINKIILGMTFVIFLSILIYISFDATPKSRVFLSAILPLLYVMYLSIENQKNTKSNLIFLAGIGFFILLFIKQNIFTYNSTKDFRATQFNQQSSILEQYLQTGNSIVLTPDFHIEYYPVFNTSSIFQSHQLFFTSWATNIPFNKGYFDSFMDLVNRHAIFMTKEAFTRISAFEKNIQQNYGITVVPRIQKESKDYVIVKLISENKKAIPD